MLGVGRLSRQQCGGVFFLDSNVEGGGRLSRQQCWGGGGERVVFLDSNIRGSGGSSFSTAVFRWGSSF
jgi:hypothetical protein